MDPAKISPVKDRLFLLTLGRPDPIQLYCCAFRETKIMLFKKESALSLQRMTALSKIDVNYGGEQEPGYYELVDQQIRQQDTLLYSLVDAVLGYLNVEPKAYKQLFVKLTETVEFENDEEQEYQKEFYKHLDETDKQTKQVINSWIDESVRDSCELIENKFSEYRLKEMDEYIKETEVMIFKSLVTNKSFVISSQQGPNATKEDIDKCQTRKAIHKGYKKAMLIRKDEFLKKYGVTIDYIEAYFRVKDG